MRSKKLILILVIFILLAVGVSGEIFAEYITNSGNFPFYENAATAGHNYNLTVNTTGQIHSVELEYYKDGSPTGNIYVQMYGCDVDGKPTGVIKANSTVVDATTLPGAGGTLTNFSFPSPYSATADEKLCFWEGKSNYIDGANYIRTRYTTIVGNGLRYYNGGAWTNEASRMGNIVVHGSSGGPPPTSDNLNLSTPTPLTNAQFSTNSLNFNAFVNSSYTFNCSLYLNGTINHTFFNYSNGTDIPVNFFKNMSEGSHNYMISCYNNETQKNSTVSNFYVDTVVPDFTTTLDGNGTYWTGNLNLNLTLIDNVSLYSLNISDSCSNSYYNASSLDENVSIVWTNFNCSIGTQQTNITLCDGFLSPITCTTKQFVWGNMAQLNITAWNLVNDSSISEFSIFRSGILLGNTSSGLLSLINLTSGDHNLTINSLGFVPTSQVINISNTTQSYNFTLYTSNSVNIIIKEEETGSLITELITLTFTSVFGDFVNSTSTGGLYLDELNATTYVILFDSVNYSSRTYTLTVGNATTQTLTAFLSKNTSTTLFTISDDDTSEVLEGVFATMLRVINGTWQPVESKYTDITGKVQFNYVENANYKFFLSKPNYDDYVFYLNPILFAEYDIKMEKTTSINYSSDFDKLSVIYSPSQFNNNAVTRFDFIISAPYGTLVNYGINLTYPGGSNATTGTNAIGEQLTLNIIVTNATVFNTVQLDYFYTTSVSGLREFTVLLPIMFPNGTGSAHTFIANKDTTFGLSVFERVLIMTFVVLMVIGIATLVGQPLPGLALGLFVFGYCVFIGFIPLWAILPSMLIGVLFLMWKSGGY